MAGKIAFAAGRRGFQSGLEQPGGALGWRATVLGGPTAPARGSRREADTRADARLPA